ncbi:hypothetical protein HD554DRAFT_2026792 [Boletus coccyginus]|nr:hypothetical protein HD554DRAFT_2026792 [Boletus coccyginus]
MLSSTVSTLSQRPTAISDSWPTSLAQAHTIPLAQITRGRTPVHVLTSCQHSAFQDARPYGPYIYRHPVDQRSPLTPKPYEGQHSSPCFQLVVVLNACPQCQRHPKLPDHRFCSVACRQSAARSAPELKYLHPHHELFITIATRFVQCWKLAPRPKVRAVYMITWTESSQRSFEQYSRDAVETRGRFKRMGRFPGNEQKRFRSTVRACTLGERGNLSPCHNEACWVCETIQRSVMSSDCHAPRNAGGIRLGAGIYTSHTSSKADQYAKNIHDPSSRIKAMLVCRVVIGKPYEMCCEDQTIRGPPPGYDCVGRIRLPLRVQDEYVVYNADAIRPAYLVLYETARGA